MTNKQLDIISNALLSAQYYLCDNLQAICDESYYEETQCVLNEIEQAMEIIKNIRVKE